LFPTVDLWENKGFWSRLFSAAAAPCVFLFTITLPVLEADLEEDKMSDSDALDSALPSPDIAKYSGERPPLASERHPLALTSQEALDRDRGSELSEERVQLRGERSQSGQFIPLPSPPPYRENGPSVSPFPIDEPPAFEDYAEDVLLSPTWKPPPPPKEWGRWLVCLQAFAAPFLILYVAWLNDADMQDPVFLHPVAVSILCSYALLCFLLATTSPITPPMWRNSLSLLGCLLAITWISTIANEVVGVIKSIGVILDVSETILGLTVLSLGNSLGELVADVTVARLGYPIMALSACIIGPMINLLLGVGIGVTYLSAADEVGPNGFKVPIAVRVSGAAVLISLIWLLLMVWVRNWALDRLVASGLFAIWTISVVGYVVIEVLEIG
jgi:sodium/potassium/calcium exchanger 6